MSQPFAPLLSVVIPTHQRPHFLPRAIKSALESAPDGSVEVIVVPNGPDESWKLVAEKFKDNNQVHWHPIPTPHANVARNHGMSLAQGKFIRFLDDDDYLYPESCKAQCETLLESGNDISSGSVNVVKKNGLKIKTSAQPASEDFIASTLSPNRLTLPTAHLYRSDILRRTFWDANILTRQDVVWLIKIAATQDIKWEKHNAAVGAWVQHTDSRISRGRDPGSAALKETSETIQWAYKNLYERNELNEERRQAAADALWACLQKGLRYDICYWIRIAKIADSYAQGRRPPSLIHRTPLIGFIPPITIELILIPIRIAYHPFRRILDSLGINRT